MLSLPSNWTFSFSPSSLSLNILNVFRLSLLEASRTTESIRCRCVCVSVLHEIHFTRWIKVYEEPFLLMHTWAISCARRSTSDFRDAIYSFFFTRCILFSRAYVVCMDKIEQFYIFFLTLSTYLTCLLFHSWHSNTHKLRKKKKHTAMFLLFLPYKCILTLYYFKWIHTCT